MVSVVKVLCISDGKPGHYNQSKGVLLALEKLFEIDVEWLDVKLRWRLLRPLYKLVFKEFGFYHRRWFINLLYSGPSFPINKPDIIISTGGNTLYLNAALKKQSHAKNIFVGGMRGLPASLFDINMVLKSSGFSNQVETALAPTVIELLPKPVQENVWMMAIGGDSGNYQFTHSDWDRLLEFMLCAQRELGVHWLITTSRRTGVDAENYLKEKVKKSSLRYESVWYVSNPKPVMNEYLTRSENVFCTEDSFSMLTESISSGRRVVSLRPECVKQHAFYDWALQRLIDKHYAMSVSLHAPIDIVALIDQVSKLEPIEKPVSAAIALQLQPLLKGL